MREEIKAALQREFSHWEGSVASPVPRSEIQAAETALGVDFPEDYREFLHEFGGAVVRGTSILGLRQPSLMPDDPPFVTDESLQFRSELPDSYHKMVVVSVDGFGNPIGFVPPDFSIITYDFDFGGKSMIASSFEEYLALLLSDSET